LAFGLNALTTYVGQSLVDTRSAGPVWDTKTTRPRIVYPTDFAVTAELVAESMGSQEVARTKLWPILLSLDPTCPAPPSQGPRHGWLSGALDASEANNDIGEASTTNRSGV